AGSLANASSVGAKTVNGPASASVLPRPAASTAASSVVNEPASRAVSTMFLVISSSFRRAAGRWPAAPWTGRAVRPGSGRRDRAVDRDGRCSSRPAGGETAESEDRGRAASSLLLRTEPRPALDMTVQISRPRCQESVECVYSHAVSTGTGALRIGEFARRVGVSPELLRAWERRYGLLQP